MTQNVDVLIVGSGSAGCAVANWLARCNVTNVKILEKRGGPLRQGQADGVACRTVELFDSWNMGEELLREAYHVVELAFWSWDSNYENTKGAEGGIIRTRVAPDTPPGISHWPHVILNQARINDLMLIDAKKHDGPAVDYGYDVRHVEVDAPTATDHDAYAVTVRAERGGVEEDFRAKYVLACDGAHSNVRRALGYKMIGDSSDAVWGVMDIYPRTNFPDVRKKTAINTPQGNLLIIPREGGSLVRFYIELPPGTKPKEVKLEDLHSAAQRIFSQYTMDIAETHWWSVYSIGQRLADNFAKDNRVFLTGDACHTHSPQAGQGMNCSLQDGYNMGWKLAMVLRGTASPALLETYTSERGQTAADLISFDRKWTKMFNAKNQTDPSVFYENFIKAQQYTAGISITYADSIITSVACSTQSLATKLSVGMRVPSAQVVRVCDAKPMQLPKALPADGRWRIVVFGGDFGGNKAARERVQSLGSYLSSDRGPILRCTGSRAMIDSIIETILVLHGDRKQIQQDELDDYYWPSSGKWAMRDLNKVFVDDNTYTYGHGKAYKFYGINPAEGAVVVVRPDQYVSLVTSLDNHAALGSFFAGFTTVGHDPTENGH